jgi:hypothetical protein
MLIIPINFYSQRIKVVKEYHDNDSLSMAKYYVDGNEEKMNIYSPSGKLYRSTTTYNNLSNGIFISTFGQDKVYSYVEKGNIIGMKQSNFHNPKTKFNYRVKDFKIFKISTLNSSCIVDNYYKINTKDSSKTIDGKILYYDGKIHNLSYHHIVESKERILLNDSLNVKISIHYSSEKLPFKLKFRNLTQNQRKNFKQKDGYHIVSDSSVYNFNINHYDLGQNFLVGDIYYFYDGIPQDTSNFYLQFFVVEKKSQLKDK